MGQNPGVFGGSVRDNLVMGATDISDEEIIELCRVSGLSEVLKFMPNGLSFHLSENGKELIGWTTSNSCSGESLFNKPKLFVF